MTMISKFTGLFAIAMATSISAVGCYSEVGESNAEDETTIAEEGTSVAEEGTTVADDKTSADEAQAVNDDAGSDENTAEVEAPLNASDYGGYGYGG